ncbi:MAG: hypothetical protein ACRETY_14170 [Steroidobacteraceae bacterium]
MSLSLHGFANVRADPVSVPKWERGTTELLIVARLTHAHVGGAIGGSIDTLYAGVEAEMVYLRDAEVSTTLAASNVEGRIVFIDSRMPRIG